MLTLKDYDYSYGHAEGIVVDDVNEIIILDADDNDVTDDLKSDMILYDGDESSFLEVVFGAGLTFLALVALDTPLFSDSDIGKI